MTISTNDRIVKLGTALTLEANGASIANNAIGVADDDSYSRATDGSDAPDGYFVFSGAFGTAPTENTTLDIYYQELNISGTNDEQTPETTYKTKYACSLTVNNVTTTQYLKSRLVRDVPPEFSASLYNNATGQTLSAGWTLVFVPQTDGPKPA